jgi:integrase
MTETTFDVDAVLERFRQFLIQRKELGKPLGPHGPTLTSDGTIQTYMRVARRFLLNMAVEYGLPPPEDAVRQYFAILRRRVKPRTILLNYAVIKNLHAAMGWPFTIEWRQVVGDELERFVDAPYLTKEELDKVVKYAEERARDGNPIHMRDAVIIILLKYGLRPADILRLTIQNISFEKMKEGEDVYEAAVIRYKACKRGREVTKILNREASVCIARWIGFLESIYDPVELLFAPLIPGFRNKTPPNIKSPQKKLKVRLFKPLSYKQLYNIVKRIMVEALGPKMRGRRSPYTIRRGVITYLLGTAKATPEELCRFFGWRTLTMPVIYDKRKSEDIARKFVNII